MRGGWFVVLLACDRGAEERPVPPPPPGPRDVVVVQRQDAAQGLAQGARRSDDLAWRDRSPHGRALGRHIKVVARRDDAATTTLIFDGYFPDDHTSIRGVRAPFPRGERLVKGTSIVGRLVAVPPAELYVEHDVDWVTDAHLDVQDGYTLCTPVR